MANDRQSLTNYETILWLWDATDEQRIMFLASLSPDQRTQFCDVLRDVLNNPWEGRSALKLTKLNKLLGQNVDRIKKQVQFSGDRTPELDEAQIFRLLHDYMVLNHDGTRSLSDLGKQNLVQLLMTVDAEFETYYGRDEAHPMLIWNGFQNDTEFVNEGMEKTQVEPSDYHELSQKITNYYYPVGGGPRPRPQSEEEEYREEYQRAGDDENGPLDPDSMTAMHMRYLPFFAAYLISVAGIGFLGIESGWMLLFTLVTLFGSVKWYNIFKFYDRGWAALLQGFWVVFYIFTFATSAFGGPMAVFNFIWPVVAFWYLAHKLHAGTDKQKKFIKTWAIVLAAAGLAGSIGASYRAKVAEERRQAEIQRKIQWRQQQQRQEKIREENFRKAEEQRKAEAEQRENERQRLEQARREAIERKRSEEQARRAKQADDHIAALRSRPGGIGWHGLVATDYSRLTSAEVETLRMQLTSVMRRSGGSMAATALANLAPADNGNGCKATLALNENIYVFMNDRSGLADALGIGNAVSSIALDVKAGESFDCRLSVSRSQFRINRTTAYVKDRTARLMFAHELDEVLARKRQAVVLVDSEAHRDMIALKEAVLAIDSQVKADEMVVNADPEARGRIASGKAKIDYLRQLVNNLKGSGGVVSSLPEDMKRIVRNGDWSQMPPPALQQQGNKRGR